jgi:hypothetical protein
LEKKSVNSKRPSAASVPISTGRETLLQEIYSLDGMQMLNRLLEQPNAQQLLQKLPNDDFYWLVKKIGDDDCLPLLELASENQWQHLFDLELWKKDRLSIEQAFKWFNRIHLADSARLVQWMFTNAQAVTMFYLFKSVVVEIRQEDETYDIKEGFFTFDDVFYVKILEEDEEKVKALTDMLRTMARADINMYHDILLNIGGILPAETEEDLYRIRNVRLAEHGFLPFEEALAIYAPLNHNAIRIGVQSPEIKHWIQDQTIRDLAPLAPIFHAKEYDLLMRAASMVSDALCLDKIKLEFSTLCNQIISADGIEIDGFEILLKVCQKAAGYLNLALESLCDGNIHAAAGALSDNSMEAVFRVGFGMTLKLKWEAERWLKQSWFKQQGLEFRFWGDQWGGTLAGITAKKPMYYIGLEQDEAYRGFERLSEFNDCRETLHRLIGLDRLFERLTRLSPLENKLIQLDKLTFYPLIFNFWARQLLELELSFVGLPLKKTKELFTRLRSQDNDAPFRMAAFEDVFIIDMLEYAGDLESENRKTLKNTLVNIWRTFREEFEYVPIDGIDSRYTELIWITP